MLSEGIRTHTRVDQECHGTALGQTRTHMLVGREEDARRFRQSCAAQESAVQSCLTAPRLENCELTAKVSLRSTQAMNRAQTAHLRSRRRRANTHRERPCASPTIRGGRHSRATSHFGFSRSRQTIQNVGLPALFHESGRQAEFRLPESFGWVAFRPGACGWRGSKCSGGYGQPQTLHPVP